MNGTWKHRCALMGAAVALLSATCFAAVGDLEYAKSPPPFGRGVFVSCTPTRKVKQADKLEQLGAVEAVVGEGTAKGIKVSAAAIRTKADTEEFDTIRVDLTGKGDFRNASKMALKTDQSASSYYAYYASIEPGQATVNKDGKDIPVTVTGCYQVSGGRPHIWLTLAAAVEGTCAFGKEIRKVRILDTIGDLKFGGGPASPRASERELELTSELAPQVRLTLLGRTSRVPPGLRGADRIQVADAKGRFDDVKISGGTLLGSPVQVGRRWFLVRVNGMKASAEPLKAPMGKIAGSADNWQVHLTGKKYGIIVNGAAKAVPVPADSYQVVRCIYFRPDQRGKAVPAVKSYSYRPPSQEVAEGETAKIGMGLPMKVTMLAKVSAGKVTFSVKRVDAAGRSILRVMNAAGERPAAPAIDVVDKTGKVVYTAKLEYG
jgi:hypothetical protein